MFAYRAPFTRPDFASLVTPLCGKPQRGEKIQIFNVIFQISVKEMNKVVTLFCQ